LLHVPYLANFHAELSLVNPHISTLSLFWAARDYQGNFRNMTPVKLLPLTHANQPSMRVSTRTCNVYEAKELFNNNFENILKWNMRI
jgi:hypothetical protein